MILDKILEQKRVSFEQDILSIMPKTKGNIAKRIKEKDGLFVVGEIKKASPSKGVLVQDFHPVSLALQYDHAGVDAISILTEKNFFQGDVSYLCAISKQSKLPLLRKDFIMDVREIIQAKQCGASLILLIVAMLNDEQLMSFYQVARALDLECIVEVHDEEQLQRALRIQPEIIGINNRNLTSFQVDLHVSKRLRPMIPSHIAVISESGISTHDDLVFVKEAGVDGVLIGESFMKARDMSAHLKALLQDE